MLALLFKKINRKITLLGEAPIQTQAIAQKRRKTPMCKTGIVELRLFIK